MAPSSRSGRNEKAFATVNRHPEDVFVIASAPSERQDGAIVDEVEDRLRDLGSKPVRREGEREGQWVLLDFADIVVHVQHTEMRAYYALERLWSDCPTIPLA